MGDRRISDLFVGGGEGGLSSIVRLAHLRATHGAPLQAPLRATPVSLPGGGFPHHTATSGGLDLPRSPRHIKAAQW